MASIRCSCLGALWVGAHLTSTPSASTSCQHRPHQLFQPPRRAADLARSSWRISLQRPCSATCQQRIAVYTHPSPRVVGVSRLPALRDQGRTSRPPSGNDLARAASLTNQDVDNLSQFNNSLMCCELLDVRTRTVVEENPAIMALSDFILSSVLVSRVLAMVAERREVERVLAELLGPYGQEVRRSELYRRRVRMC